MNSTPQAANRATRLRLRARLELAHHAAELLHSKEEALRRERTRLEGYAIRSRQQWEDSCRDAGAQLLRARAFGASRELSTSAAQPGRVATVSIDWQHDMGVTYPGRVMATPGSPGVLTSTAALVPATTAYGVALGTGAEYAAAAAALVRVEAELGHTRRRRRGIEQRLRPRLEAQLHQLDLELDERDREAALRSQNAIEQNTIERSTRP